MSTYIAIKELNGKENKRLIEVLRYIAEGEGCMSCGNVQFRNLYYQVLRQKFIETARRDVFNGRVVTISIKQYKRLRKHTRGRFSINTAVYLLTLYEIMLDYNKKARLTPKIDGITYTEYIVDLLLGYIKIIINPDNLQTDYIDQEDYDILSTIYDEFTEIDNLVGENEFKIYNDIW